ncbi:MAG: PEP-CTERM sorting domain-containing protein [Microcoleus sp.]
MTAQSINKTSLTIASLTTAILLGICSPARAFMFGTTGIQFDEDTTVRFTFDQSHGIYQSSLWVAQSQTEVAGYTNVSRLFYEIKSSDNGRENEWKGTAGNTVFPDKGAAGQNFTFLKGQVYALLLWSDTGSGRQFEQYVSSSTFMNSPEWFAADSRFRRLECLAAGCQQAVFGDFNLSYDAPGSFSASNGGVGPEEFQAVTMAQLARGTKISFDDGGGQDADFQDFSVTAQLAPEPVTLFGTLLGIGALGAARTQRKRHRQARK